MQGIRNIGRIFARDVKRLLHAPAALIVVAALLVLPSLYTWFNVKGFWDPYSNTANLTVCVVNEDRGVTDETLGMLDLGSQVVDRLHENDRLGWVFTDRTSALEAVNAGKAYAAFVIPETFSADLVALIGGGDVRPTLEYYVNEKVSPVAPKITDVGATTLDTTINDAFVSAVTAVVAQRLEENANEVQADLSQARDSALSDLGKAIEGIGDAQASLDNLTASMATAMQRIDEAKLLLSSANQQIESVSSGLAETAALTEQLNTELMRFSLAAGTALDDASLQLGKAIAQTDYAVKQTASSISSARGSVDAALSQGDVAAQHARNAAQALRDVAEALPEESDPTPLLELASSLEAEAAQAEQVVSDLRALSDSLDATGRAVLDTASAANGRAQDALGRADEYRKQLSEETIPAVSRGIAQITVAAGSISAAVASQSVLIGQADVVLDQLKSTLSLSQDALAQTGSVLGGLADDMALMRNDVASLQGAEAIARAFRLNQLDVSKVADFMMSPTVVKAEKFYVLDNYGSAMAPLFMNLTLWIGVFMLMVIMRLEVDDKGIRQTTASQRYIARGLLLAVLAAIQAVVCCTGCLILGIQCASMPLLFLTAVTASLAYLSIQYALSTILQHVGKALCIILVFVQIPGASGLYPIEMTPAFFRAVYPFFPFTYGINAMREAIFGFYEGIWASNIAMLIVFLVGFTALGALVRPYFANLNRLFAKQIEASDIVNIESAELPERHYRISQILRVLADREEYRVEMQQRADRFMQLYPRLKAWAAVLGIAVPAVATPVLAVSQATKAAMLALWLGWLVVIVLFLVGIEYMKDALERRLSLDALTDAQVQALYLRKGRRSGTDSDALDEGDAQ